MEPTNKLPVLYKLPTAYIRIINTVHYVNRVKIENIERDEMVEYEPHCFINRKFVDLLSYRKSNEK